MPLGFERLNERTQRPNANVNFIKPLPGPDSAIAKDFLERIAAQCYPIMKEHYISVMALEEHEPNPEFLGRNFNAGEVIQLVLKDKSGRWLSFKFVQMVMMHELAHCKQMNHSRFFWGVRNGYAKQMEDLWAKNYKGEGMWGRGKDLTSGQFVHDRMPEDAQIPEHLCGGTYRRARGKKRKRGQDGADKEKLSYAERQQKRIARKFGKHGEGSALGDDELVRGALDGKSGKRYSGKPRVANSKRGRELRANAALARFESIKKRKTPEKTPELEDDAGSETESGWSSDDDIDYSSEAIILRRKGGQIKDQHGRDMVKVCGDENEEAEGGQDEVDELRILSGKPKGFPEKVPTVKGGAARASSAGKDPWPKSTADDSETESEPEQRPANRRNRKQVTTQTNHDAAAKPIKRTTSTAVPVENPAADSETESEPEAQLLNTKRRKQGKDNNKVDSSDTLPQSPSEVLETPQEQAADNSMSQPSPTTRSAPAPTPITTAASCMTACPICSLENDLNSPTCIACSHVLKTSLVKNAWRCKSEACQGSKYVNAGDVGRCGLCGAQKPAAATVAEPQARGMGTMSADVLRWD